MRKIMFMTGAVALLLVLTGCNGTKRTATNAAKVDRNLVEKYWKLIELYGNPVVYPVNFPKEAYIFFQIDGNRFYGDAGCNRILGSYQLTGGNRIILSPAASTMMMCIDMDVETKFLEVLKTADSYFVRNDTLTLNRARMAPLARLVAVKK